MDKTQIAINTESFLDYLDNDADIRKALQAVKEIGYESVELWHVKGPEHQASWRPFLDEAGLRCCAIHELYEEVMEHIDGTIAKAKDVGAGILAIGRSRDTDWEDEASIRKLAEGLNELGRKCQTEGIQVLYHNHNTEFSRFGDETGLDLLFVAVFHWGIAGAAIATVAAQVLSAGLVLGVLTRSRGCYRIQWRGMRMHRGILRNIFVVGVPSALQLAITSFSNVFVQSYVNRFASSCMAGWAAYQKIDAFVILPMTTLSVTATTFVGQNVGAGNWDRAKQGIRCALAMATVVTGVLLVPLMVFAQPLCTLFNQEPEVLGYGVYFIRLISPFYLVANFNQIYAGALRGAGDAKVPMVIMLGSFVVFRQLYLFVTYQVAGTLLPVALGYPVGWVVCSGVLLWYYRSGRWMAHSLVTPAGRGTDRERE